MKTLLVVSHSSSLTGGGEEDFLRLIKYLHGKYNLIGIFPEGNKICEYEKYVNEYLVIPNRMFPFTKFSIKSYLGYFIKASDKYELIKKFLINKKIDLAYLHSSVCIYETLVINKLKIPYVISIREFINPLFIRRIVYRYYLKTSKNIIVISKMLFDQFKKLNFNSDKVILIHPGIEDHETEISNPEKETVFLSIGNLFPEKGQDKVIEAFGKIKNFYGNVILKIIGANVNEKYYEYLKSSVVKLNLEKSIIFTGELSRQKVDDEITKSKAVIISSMYEGFSLVLLEALSRRIPVISTHVGVVPDIITNGENGLLYDFGDTDMLAEKIKLLLSDEKLYKKLSENGYNTFEKSFKLSDSLSKIEKVFQSVMN